MKILVRGTNWLGDAVMTAPALQRLREKFPGAQISLLSPAKLCPLWLHHPAVDQSIAFEPEETIFAVAGKLRAGKFDLALVLPNSPRSALEVFLAGIPQRIGYARPWRNFFLTQAVPPRKGAAKMRQRSLAEIQAAVAAPHRPGFPAAEKTIAGTAGLIPERHHIREYLNLVAALGASAEPLPPQFRVAPEECEAARKKFGLDQIAAPLLGLNPGAEYGPAKRWPVEKFIATAQEIRRRTGGVWILFGGKSDEPIAGRIESALASRSLALFNLAGRTSLRELMALLKSCRVLLTNDTGPMHLAAALEVPVVAVFGSTAPELTGPVSSAPGTIVKSDAPCSPCFLRECPIDFRCMNGISVERVVEAVVAVLKP
ncbi:MAG TPA: lipopolysaccharide heptosyltransferase II [Verrucomicrobiae bacterium]|nr:lipopolysaccharide heptosyltransferase II [Verrucomicrobiae bacterium]